MNLTKKQLKAQFDFAKISGWLAFFMEAVETFTKGYFDEADLLAIASRETNLDPKWLKKLGDGGHGAGLMQADIRSFPDFIKSGKWKDARSGILFGADVLMQKWIDTNKCIGKKVSVRSSKGGTFSFVGKEVHAREAQRVSIAAYNAGRWGHYAVSTGRDVDSFTTGKDYSSDVIMRASYLRILFNEWKAKNFTETNVENNPSIVPPAADVQSVQSDVQSDNSSLKDFSDKYLKHLKGDSAKNIALVVSARIAAGVSALWTIGITGKVFLIIISIVFLAVVGYAFWFYNKRLFGWIKTIFDSLFNS